MVLPYRRYCIEAVVANEDGALSKAPRHVARDGRLGGPEFSEPVVGPGKCFLQFFDAGVRGGKSCRYSNGSKLPVRVRAVGIDAASVRAKLCVGAKKSPRGSLHWAQAQFDFIAAIVTAV